MVRDLHVYPFRLNNPSILIIARSEWPDRQGYSIRMQSSPSFENPFSYLQTLFQGWSTTLWLSRSCSKADIFASSGPYLHGGRSVLGPLVRLTEYVKFTIFSVKTVANDCFRNDSTYSATFPSPSAFSCILPLKLTVNNSRP